MGWLERLFPSGSRANPPFGEDPGISSYDPAQRVLPNPYEPFVGSGFIVADPGVPFAHALGKADIERYWSEQPNLRKVVSFIARTVGGVPFHLYDRKGDTDRVRVHESPLAAALRKPGQRKSPFRLWESIVADGCLYDRWVILVAPDDSGKYDLIRMPAWRTRLLTDSSGEVTDVLYWTGTEQDIQDRRLQHQWVKLPMDQVVFDHGYAPRTAGLSPVHTLKALFEEAKDGNAYRKELLQNGPRVPAWIERPKEAPRWKDDTHRQRFINGIRDYVAGGASAGGWPLIEDGMIVHDRTVLKPNEVNDIEGRTWSNVEVTTAYHISPEILGVRPGTFANVDAFRQMLWGGAQLGPYVTALESALDTQLTGIIEPNKPTFYIEANLESQLRGSFAEQASVKQSATGAPWLTRNEARALENRPPVPGGDELVVPLNVLIGGLAAPNDTDPNKPPPAAPPPKPPETPSEPPQSPDEEGKGGHARLKAAGDVQKAQLKRARRELIQSKYEQELGKFFQKQTGEVRARMGRKTPGWWDGDRYDNELTELMLKLHLANSTRAARDALEAAGVDPDQYDPDRTINYLTAVAQNSGKAINAKTLEMLEAALDDEDPDAKVDEVFEANEGWRLEHLAAGAVTMAIGFGMSEAASQTRAATKTWITGPNPRPEHAGMDGETVPVSENFSNGLAWPGDPSGGADDLAGCNCELQFNY